MTKVTKSILPEKFMQKLKLVTEMEVSLFFGSSKNHAQKTVINPLPTECITTAHLSIQRRSPVKNCSTPTLTGLLCHTKIVQNSFFCKLS